MSANRPIIQLQRAAIPSVVPVTARAFEHDPMFTYIFPNPTSRYRLLRRFFRPVLHYGVMYGVVYTTSDFAGNALWLTPEQPDITPLGMARSGMLLLPLTIGVMAFRRFLTFTAYAETCHKQTMNEPHWYLLNLGVDPTNHGRGIGSALMQPVFAQADAHHVPCYLETNNPRNLPFYERHGFHVAHAGEVPHGGPQFWAMIRPPQRK